MRWHLLWHAGRVVAAGGLEPVAVAGGRQHGGVVHDPVDDRGGGRNTRLRTYLTPVSTEPFSQPFAGAQNSARNG